MLDPDHVRFQSAFGIADDDLDAFLDTMTNLDAVEEPLRPGTFRASNGVTLALSAAWDFEQ